ILTSSDRNLRGRNDANNLTRNILASAEVVTAISAGGRISFNPKTESITTS
ncbi:hypothetical protein B0J17DRAFT_563193, partial [Rhizoctonia solani]